MLTVKELIVDILEGFDMPTGNHSLEEIAERLEDGVIDLLETQKGFTRIVKEPTIFLTSD